MDSARSMRPKKAWLGRQSRLQRFMGRSVKKCDHLHPEDQRLPDHLPHIISLLSLEGLQL
ncbi:hypothetical protein MUK42_29735 [Musa troglodytarum]|uniref:Uncharacterized protein n=1 Tax=Musa troglodytarum TaxID=320322 RepID=A0A9E7GFA0_9LILI|nr:hypothetical protein MUK42_29735 [Musa troglodytarum]